MASKKLSQLEMSELFTIYRQEPNRLQAPRIEHLLKRGLIESAPETYWRHKLSSEGLSAMRKAGIL